MPVDEIGDDNLYKIIEVYDAWNDLDEEILGDDKNDGPISDPLIEKVGNIVESVIENSFNESEVEK